MRALPPSFLKRIEADLGPAFAPFLATMQEQPPVSIRLHAQKTTGNARDYLDAALVGPQVPWHPHGWYLTERPSFTTDPFFQAGGYYVQEASSMFLLHALAQIAPLRQSLRVLDLCAAPGGKSTLLQSAISSDSLLVANETIRPRIGALKENLEKWGLPNKAIASADPSEMKNMEAWFDVVVVDAPCSGEGMFRKDPDAIAEWSPAHVEFCAARQKRIVTDAIACLKPGGSLLYSTCTFNQMENDENVEWMVQTFDLEKTALAVPAEWNINQTRHGFSFLPHLVAGEGFYLAALRKKSGPAVTMKTPAAFKSLKPLSKDLRQAIKPWFETPEAFAFYQTPSAQILALPTAFEGDYLTLDHQLKTKWVGLDAGIFKGKDFIPTHDLAQSTAVASAMPRIECTREQALVYMKKENPDIDTQGHKGWVLATYKDLALGWMKVMPGRINNYLPLERRIRMAI